MSTPKLKIQNNTPYSIDNFDFIRQMEIIGEVEEKIQGKEIGICFVDDVEMRDLNKRFFGRDSVTDVLTFSNEFAELPYLGEIIINLEQLVREGGDNLQEGMTGVLIHGVLHLLGYDHINSAESLKMSLREEELNRKVSGVKI